MKCEIIRDLLPLYIENLCSEESLSLIHIFSSDKSSRSRASSSCASLPRGLVPAKGKL